MEGGEDLLAVPGLITLISCMLLMRPHLGLTAILRCCFLEVLVLLKGPFWGICSNRAVGS